MSEPSANYLRLLRRAAANDPPPAWSLMLLAMILHSVFLLPTRNAPAPFARPGKDVVGVWQAPGVRVTFSPDGTYLERWHGFDFVGRWRVERGVVVATYPHCDWPREPPFRVAFRPDGERLKMIVAERLVEITLERVP